MPAAIGLLWRVLRTQLLYERKYVYMLLASQLDRVPTFDIPGYSIQCLSQAAAIEDLERELRAYPGMLPDEVSRLLAGGALFWVGRMHGRLASLGVSRRGTPLGGYFWPLPSSCITLSHFATAPQFRGQGLYPAMLSHIVREQASCNVEYFLIECGDWNIGSRRGIERAGFEHIGYGKATVRGRLSWYPLPPAARAGSAQPVAEQKPARAKDRREPVHL